MTVVVRVAAAVIAVILIAGFAVTRPHPTVAPAGSVVRIIDGDTIVVGGSGTVRILLVDAPETHDNSHGPKGCYAFAAKDFLAGLLPVGTQVSLIFDKGLHDRWGRLLAYVEVDGVDVGRELVAAGLAEVVFYPPNKARLDDYRRVEADADARGVGLWSPDCRP